MDLRLCLQQIRENNQKVLVVGLGISGIESVEFLSRINIIAIGIDKTTQEDFFNKSPWKERVEVLAEKGVRFSFGIDGESVSALLDGVSLAITSPGISLESSIYGALKRRNIPLVSEFELGIILRSTSSRRAPIVAVTGSNGKSTTVSLIHNICQTVGRKSVLCGNVGVPVIANLSEEHLLGVSKEEEILVVEASSYQLESCFSFKPFIGILLNLSDNHLERHGTMERYREAKLKMFLQQEKGDYALLNLEDPLVKGVEGRVRSELVTFGANNVPNDKRNRAVIEYEPLYGVDKIKIYLNSTYEEYDLSSSKLIGLHNRYNIAASTLAGRLLGIENHDINKALHSFKPLEHRLEILNAPYPFTIINDSKSTTVASTRAAVLCALEKFRDKNLILLLGGLVKAGSWMPLIEILVEYRSRIPRTLCFGKDGRILAHYCEQAGLACKQTKDMKDAVLHALRGANADDVILFSPGCASFDEFRDFEERGREFKRLVVDG